MGLKKDQYLLLRNKEYLKQSLFLGGAKYKTYTMSSYLKSNSAYKVVAAEMKKERMLS